MASSVGAASARGGQLFSKLKKAKMLNTVSGKMSSLKSDVDAGVRRLQAQAKEMVGDSESG